MSKTTFEKAKEVLENMSVKFWHESNKFCRDWWDSIVDEDHMPFAGIDLGCVNIEAHIMGRYNDTPEVSYLFHTKCQDGSWKSQNLVIVNCNEYYVYHNRIETWDDVMNDMLFTLIEYCDKNEIDYEADYYSSDFDIKKELEDKLTAEFSAYVKSIPDKKEAIKSHYKITMMNEFRNALNEMAENMSNKEIRKRFIKEDNILEQLYRAFLKRDTGEMETYKEIINEEMKGDER